MDRRAKNRLPAASRKQFKGLPVFVLIVSATLTFSAEALARINGADGDTSKPMIIVKEQDGGDTYTKTYTKEELKKKLPANPITSLNQRLMTELTGLLNGVRNSFGGAAQRKSIDGLKTLTPTEEDINFHIATLHDAPETRKANKDAIRSFMGGEAQKVGSSIVKSHLPYVGAIGSGFNFNLDFDTFFSESKTKNEQKGQVRYSLILKDIKPAAKGVGTDRAALSDAQQEMQFAGHADVEWTIGPLMEDHNRKILTEAPMELEQKKPRSFLGLRIPKFSFKGGVKPENFDNLSKVKKDSMPTWRLDLAQSEGFYNMVHKSDFNGKKISTEHLFRTPVAGTVELGRRFSDNWDVLQTSAYNILYDKRLPLLSVHYLNIEQRYAADLGTNVGGATVSVSARTEATGTVKAEDKPRQYSVNVTKSF
jgi:hypothetical protein